MRSLIRPAAVLVLSAAALAAQTGWRKVEQTELNDAQVQDIITKFAAKEADFARARENYTYRQTARVQELEPGGAVIGKWEMITDIIFSPEGKRTERVVRAPMPTLKNIQLTPQDEQDLRNVQPFVLTTQDIDKYYVRYLGKQMADEIPCYVFAVRRTSATSRARSGWTTATSRSSRPTAAASASSRATTSSPSSRPTASRSTANTGSRPIPAPTTF
jgi:hypothetical protein